MSIFSIFVLALGLAMDAFAVSIANGICYHGRRAALLTALAFGFFQGLMPLLGFFAGSYFTHYIEAYDHWLAFALLAVIGGKMLLEGIQEMRQPKTADCPAEPRTLSLRLLLVQAVATSIDALAVGISFAALQVNIASAALLIALTTFFACLIGFDIGKRFGGFLQHWAVICGGVILIIIGARILFTHLGAF